MISHTEQGCILPTAQSIIAGLFSSIIAAGISMWAGWSFTWQLSLVVGASVALFWFMGSIDRWREDVYAPLYAAPEPMQETVPQITPIIVHVERQQSLLFDIPASPEQLRQLSSGLINGVPFSEDSWTPENKLFSKAQFRSVRDEFIKSKLARWVNPNSHSQGVALTHYGVETCKKVMDG